MVKEYLEPTELARDNLLVEIQYGFDGSVPDGVADNYSIPINDTETFSIDDLTFPIENKEELLNQILNLKKIEIDDPHFNDEKD